MNKYLFSSLLILAATTCLASQDIDPLRVRAIDLIPVSCTDGPTTATITLNVAGGSPSYSYSLDGQEPQQDNVFTGLSTGQHTIAIEDQAGEQLSVVVVTGPSPFSQVCVSQAPYCDDRYNKGIIAVDTANGTAPVQQELLGADEQFIGASGTFGPVVPGRYTVISTPSDSSPCIPTQITLDVILPQASGNEQLDFINGKYCNPCLR